MADPVDASTPPAGEPSAASPLARYVPLATWAIVALTFLFIAMKIVGTGYLPAGDLRRHVARAFAQKPFTEIVVMRPEYSMDNSPGWDWLLRTLHRQGGFTKDGLVAFYLAGPLLFVFLAPL